MAPHPTRRRGALDPRGTTLSCSFTVTTSSTPLSDPKTHPAPGPPQSRSTVDGHDTPPTRTPVLVNASKDATPLLGRLAQAWQRIRENWSGPLEIRLWSNESPSATHHVGAPSWRLVQRSRRGILPHSWPGHGYRSGSTCVRTRHPETATWSISPRPCRRWSPTRPGRHS